VRWREKSIGDILSMSVDEAVPFFAAHPSTHRALRLMQDVGLGYLTLGQQSPTLSGGEAQRLKLVTELAKTSEKKTLYVLDEPTVGLHMADVEKLIRVLHRLVDAGNTVVLIEHNLDVIAEADWIVDLGPEGGSSGGCVVFQGTPEQTRELSGKGDSHTCTALAEFLTQRRNPATVS
jgi:excinuclease ABC subunit A